jgi:hypothetical protein
MEQKTPTRTARSSHTRVLAARGASTLACIVALGCAGSTDSNPAVAANGELRMTIGKEGGELVGQAGTPLEGLHLQVPAGALSAPTEIAISPASDGMPLPATAVRCGPLFALSPVGLKLAVPATLTLPFDEQTITDQNRFDDEVKVWVAQGDHWGQQKQIDSSEGAVTVQIAALDNVAAGVNPPSPDDIVQFDLKPNPKFLPCLAQYPDDATRAPSVQITVVRGDLNDGLFLRGKNIKPNLAFDMFTVENSSLHADGTVNPDVKNFGLAWYQSDLEANERGSMRATIRTILLDQIFGFDPAVTLPPTSTFELGFWFNNPQDAVACGFDASKPTPFNGEHAAGPLAMISLPDADTGLGPLCTKPDTSTTPAHCSP